MTQTPLSLLNQIFGYHQFRGDQAEIIDHIISGNDALVLMPTGGGKSLCYQLPALLRPGIAIVISPLIALMQDQVTALLQLGIRAACLNSSLNYEETQQVSRQLRSGELDLLYIAPERLMTERFLAFLEQTQVALFAIDEAHCVSQWGHDFRPEYAQLSILHERYPQIPRIALTATADGPTRREIMTRLQLETAQHFVSGFDRPNIHYRVIDKNQPRQQALEFIRQEHQEDAGIIYCLSRKKVDDTALWLQQQGLNALPYHAGMPAATRKLHQHRFIHEEGLIIVATIAFGMGIDKPNVRFVIHLDLPKSIEAYYQETGRAGRDGLPANALLTYGPEDVVMLQKFIHSSDADEQHKRLELHKLDALLGFCEMTTCRRQGLLAYFEDHLPEPCNNCDTCLEPPETWDATEAAQQALSCIYRTGQRFGMSYLIDVLRGKSNDRIRNFGHEQLKVFGIGKERPATQWRNLYRQLVAQGLASVDIEGYGGLFLTDAARPILRGEETLLLRKLRPTKKQKADKRKSASLFEGTDLVLWEQLRSKRLELANAQDVPPYVIFHDATLVEMVCHCPTTDAELTQLSGVGSAKLKRYGPAFLEVIENHVIEQDLDKSSLPAIPEPEATSLPETMQISLISYQEGNDIEQIAQMRDLKSSTIYGHLARAIELEKLNLEEIREVKTEDIQTIEAALADLPKTEQMALKPLYQQLEETYSYGLLRCVMAGLLR
ncbi:DNA helicase RecQ [Candidatus Venteria ishoeyi]|uniref:DNA helicase RecQ n=1 Tax=Candidatus Venteria ishoeyi TaxID=1899563 RepID=UPI0025A5866B|nr:DNA helicase RecQ [Candidatus Venteria ishoeyi]MDM8546061.1 DNA helicase RecQ [Candidatus Venteria ishoeyi]